MAYDPPKYPGAIPSLEDLPDRVDDIDWLYAARYNELKKELRAVLTELGVLPKKENADVAERIYSIKSLAGAHMNVIVINVDNVGIGTQEPDAKLDVQDNAAKQVAVINQLAATYPLIDFRGTVGKDGTATIVDTSIPEETYVFVGAMQVENNGITRFIKLFSLKK